MTRFAAMMSLHRSARKEVRPGRCSWSPCAYGPLACGVGGAAHAPRGGALIPCSPRPRLTSDPVAGGKRWSWRFFIDPMPFPKWAGASTSAGCSPCCNRGWRLPRSMIPAWGRSWKPRWQRTSSGSVVPWPSMPWHPTPLMVRGCIRTPQRWSSMGPTTRRL
jgi:hypothetical protein